MDASRIARLLVLSALLAITAFATTASAGTTVTYTATQTIPVPPASNYAGTGGGDGWNVALTPTAVYNVFHHSSQLTVACHLQANALPCWKNSDGAANALATRTITQTAGSVVSNFATSGHSGLWVDQATAQLFIFATRTSDSAGGVVCIDTKAAETSSDALCAGHGFTPLAPAGKARWNENGSFISNFAIVGSRVFAFNFVSGSGVGDAENRLLCFDMNTFSACAGQPFALNVGSGIVSAVNYPPPAVAAIGSDVIVPINVGENDKLACFDASTNNPGGDCGVGWPVPLVTANRSISSYVSGNGAPFPLLTADGAVSGLCLPATASRPATALAPPTSGIPCFSLSGDDVETPPGMDTAITPTSGWNGPAVVVGPRVYVPNGNGRTVLCYDYNLSSGCGAAFPKSFTAHSLFLLYTVNADPQRPTCLWVNADYGTQIQNFDAFTGGVCGEDGTIRVLASSSVVATPLCAPGSWTSLQVTSPARNTYASGSVAFQDASGTAIPGAGDVQLDATGTASLSALDHAKSNGLPQFLIKLTEPQGAPGEVVVQLTWTGAFDPSCATKPGTTVVNPPSTNAPPPPKADVSVSLTAPTLSRTGSPLTFRALVSNSGPDASTGVVLRTPVPANAKLVSASSTSGNGCTLGATATCFIGTLASGASATVTMVFTTGQAGPLTIKSSAEADFDTKFDNNSSSVTATVISPTAPPLPPPPPSQPATFNAVGSGTIKVNGVDRPADQLFVLNSGDLVDVTNGVLTFTGSDGSYISVSSSQFVAARRTSGRAAATDNLPAQFKVEQPATTGELTTLTLAGGDFTTCTTPRALSADSKQPVRQLWGSAKGKFQTVGRYSAATVRGTVWLTQDRCDGTYTQVVESIVDVLDLSLQKTVAVNPGESYLALPKGAALKPPTVKGSGQTAAQVRKSGLVWSGKRFATRKAFESWLTARGGTWKHFQSTYPSLAAALASRRG